MKATNHRQYLLALMCWQAMQAYQRLKVNGSPLDSSIGNCASGCAETAALGAGTFSLSVDSDVAVSLTAGIGWTPPVIGKIHPALQSLEVKLLAARIPCQLSEVSVGKVPNLFGITLLEAGYGKMRSDEAIPIIAGSEMEKFRVEIPCQFRVAPYAAAPAQQEAALQAFNPKAQAELRKYQVEAPLSDTLAQELIGKTDKVSFAAGPQALLNGFTKMKKYGLFKAAAPNESPMGARVATHAKADDNMTLAIRGAPASDQCNLAVALG